MTREEEAIKYLVRPIVSSTDVGKEKQKELDAYNMAIKSLMQIKKIKSIIDGPPCMQGDIFKYRDICEVLKETKIGHWIKYKKPYDIGGISYFYCDNCGYITYEDEKDDFCPHCKAKMVEPQESEDKE